MVRLVGVEPTRLSALGFESSTSSIPPQAHNMDALAGADPATFAFRAQCSTVELEGDVLVDCTPVYQRCQAKSGWFYPNRTGSFCVSSRCTHQLYEEPMSGDYSIPAHSCQVETRRSPNLFVYLLLARGVGV